MNNYRQKSPSGGTQSLLSLFGTVRGRIILAVVAAALAALTWFVFHSAFTAVGCSFVNLNATELDLQNKGLTSLDGLERCTGLETLDVRGNDISAEQVQLLSEQLPGCTIIWSVPACGTTFDSTTTELDLRGRGVTSLQGLEHLEHLTSLDIRENPVDPAEAAALAASLSGCDVLWSVQVNGVYYDSTLTELDLRGTGVTDISDLRHMTALSSLDLRDNPIDTNAVRYLIGQLPDCNIVWSIPVAGQYYESTIESITIGDVSADDVARLKFFPSLRSVDATACTQYAALDDLTDALPDCSISWGVVIDGRYHSVRDTTRLTLKADISAEDLALLPYLRNLTYVDANACTQYDALYASVQKMDGCKFEYKIPLARYYDISNSRTRVNMEGIFIEDYERFKTLLGYLPNLTYINLDNCNLSNEQLDGLRQAYPYLTVRWTIQFGRWEIPTTCHVFSCLNFAVNKNRLTSEDADVLRYCTELRLIDLGHNNLTNLDFMNYMPKLQAVIVTDNPNLTDISGLANKPDLQYVEMHHTGVTDISPLAGNLALTDLYISTCTIEDYSCLHNLSNLEHFVPGPMSKESQQALKDALPNCLINGVHPNAHTEWLKSKRRAAYKECFEKWGYLDYFNSYTDYKI